LWVVQESSAIGVATATYAVGGEPSLKLKRSVSF